MTPLTDSSSKVLMSVISLYDFGPTLVVVLHFKSLIHSIHVWIQAYVYIYIYIYMVSKVLLDWILVFYNFGAGLIIIEVYIPKFQNSYSL